MASLAAVGVVLAVAGSAILLRMLPGLSPELPADVPHLVYAEFGSTSDQIYIAPATAPGRRTLVESVPHAEGWGINPGAMSGDRIVYTVLPEGANGRGAPAELWLLNVRSKDKTRLARDADLLVKPQFVDANTVIYRRSTGDVQSVIRLDIEAQSRAVVYEERTAFGITPVGFDAAGALIFARLSATGTDVLSVRPGEPPTPLFHASDEIARDWQLSPDGRAVAFLAPEARGERVVYRAQVVSLSGARAADLPEVSATGEQYGPIWAPDGHLTVGNEAGLAGTAAATLLRPGGSPIEMAPPARGFDVPFAWSDEGEFLAARTFDGADSTTPGRESAVIIGVDGERRGIPAVGEVILVGWLPRA